MTDHPRIWLQPACCGDNTDAGRVWCEDPDPVDCPDGVPWTVYVRADIVADLVAALTKACVWLQASHDDMADAGDENAAAVKVVLAQIEAALRKAAQ